MGIEETAELTGKMVVGGVKGAVMPLIFLVFFATAFQLLFTVFQAVFTGNVYR
jgi:hypothetical protein